MRETLYEHLTKLRFAEPLRRNSQVARLETNLHIARDLAENAGIKIALGELRNLTMQRTYLNEETETNSQTRLCAGKNPAANLEEQVAQNYWRMQLWVSEQWAELNPRPARKTGGILQVGSTPKIAVPTPTPTGLATLHKIASAEITGNSVPAGQVGIPQPEVAQLITKILETSEIELIDRLGLALAQNLLTPLFPLHSSEILLTWIRHQLVVKGVEPTGCLLLTAGWKTHQPQVRTWVKQAKHNGLTPENLENWRKLWLQILLDSFPPTHILLRAVQAGKLPENLEINTEQPPTTCSANKLSPR